MPPYALSKAGATGLEPATSGVTGRRSNQLNYAPEGRSVYLASQRSEDAGQKRVGDDTLEKREGGHVLDAVGDANEG